MMGRERESLELIWHRLNPTDLLLPIVETGYSVYLLMTLISRIDLSFIAE